VPRLEDEEHFLRETPGIRSPILLRLGMEGSAALPGDLVSDNDLDTNAFEEWRLGVDGKSLSPLGSFLGLFSLERVLDTFVSSFFDFFSLELAPDNVDSSSFLSLAVGSVVNVFTCSSGMSGESPSSFDLLLVLRAGALSRCSSSDAGRLLDLDLAEEAIFFSSEE
jgi:hypothetical protein